jgi:hypothetical protein
VCERVCVCMCEREGESEKMEVKRSKGEVRIGGGGGGEMHLGWSHVFFLQFVCEHSFVDHPVVIVFKKSGSHRTFFPILIL